VKESKNVNKQKVAVEILKLCADRILGQEFQSSKGRESDYAGKLAQTYNCIYEVISGPQNGE